MERVLPKHSSPNAEMQEFMPMELMRVLAFEGLSMAERPPTPHSWSVSTP
jgi:hypothetical protein